MSKKEPCNAESGSERERERLKARPLEAGELIFEMDRRKEERESTPRRRWAVSSENLYRTGEKKALTLLLRVKTNYFQDRVATRKELSTMSRGRTLKSTSRKGGKGGILSSQGYNPEVVSSKGAVHYVMAKTCNPS